MTASASVQLVSATGVQPPKLTLTGSSDVPATAAVALAAGAVAAAPARKIHNPMRSTWRQQDRSQWRWYHHVMNVMDPSSSVQSTANTPPVFAKTDPIPFLSKTSINSFVIVHSIWPILLHYLYVTFWSNGVNPHLSIVYSVYALGLQVGLLRLTYVTHELGLKFGYLDGDKHARDQVPDTGVFKTLLSLSLAGTVRPLVPLLFAWRSSETPSLSWMLPVYLTLFPIVLDFFFYFYHRACHEVDFLWRIHKTHHFTKHPNPLLTIFADEEQEFIDIVLIPTITYFTLKLVGLEMSFYDWYIVNAFVMFAEIMGHSGLRLYQFPPGPCSLLLKTVNCELVLEDHDLHHRYGWKKAVGYGKQTRLWDVVFGTTVKRVEMVDENVDWDTAAHLPLY